MSDKKKHEGYVPLKEGFQPKKNGDALGGHIPEKGQQFKTKNPPKKK